MKMRMAVCLGLGSILLALSTFAVRAEQDEAGAVYTMTNETGGNAVLVFNRTADGTLTPGGSFPSGGLGTGGREPDSGLANAGALALSEDNHLLFVVNAGSDTISVFAVKDNGLSLIDVESSGGRQPISLTVTKDLLYVLNAGGNVGATDNITGFTIGTNGKLSLLGGSTRPLSAAYPRDFAAA